MANKVTSNNMSRIITISTPGPKGDKGNFEPNVNVTTNFSGSVYSGSMLVSITTTGSIIPQGNGNWDLGSETNPFRDLYITTESLKFVSKGTGRVVSSLSAQNVEDLKVGKTITTTTKTLNRKDGTTTTRTKFVEGAAFISSLDNDVYIKTGTNRMTLVAGGAGTGNIDIGGHKQTTNLGPVRITGSLTLTGSLHVGHLAASGNYANIDFIASSSIKNLTTASNKVGSLGVGEGIVSVFDNQFHHLADRATTVNSAADPAYAERFYIGNRVVTQIAPLFGGPANQTEVSFLVSASGNVGIGTLEPQATLHVSGNNSNWGTLLIDGNITASGNISASGFITASNILAETLVVEGDSTFNNITIEAGGGISLVGSDQEVLFSSGSPSTITSSGNFKFDYNFNSLDIAGSVTCSGLISDEPIYAPAFIETGTGTPTIESNSNLVLSASNAVVIASSPLRLRSLTNTVTGSGQFSFIAGDMYFNSTTNKFMGFNGTSHVELG